MNQEKYIGMDVHDASISATVKNAPGNRLVVCDARKNALMTDCNSCRQRCKSDCLLIPVDRHAF
jgi:hypothetical protein